MNMMGVISCPNDLRDEQNRVRTAAFSTEIGKSEPEIEGKEEKKKFVETNIMYARSLFLADLPLINRVARNYINAVVGENAPLWKKEMAYNQWENEEFDPQKWERARLEMSSKCFTFG